MRRILVCTILSALTACGTTTDSDGEPRGPDAARIMVGSSDGGTAGGADAPADSELCADPSGLQFGWCLDPNTGLDCTGVAGEVSSFVPLAPGDTLRPVTGYQGAEMFVVVLRTRGIFPGDGGPENPQVTVNLHANELQVSNYHSRPNFMPDDGADTLTSQDLYLVLSGPSDSLIGETLLVDATLTDRNGVHRCGEASFIAGANSTR